MHILVVGSSVIDLFLAVDESHAEIKEDKVTLELGDKIPSKIKKFALGGNGANVSVGLTRLEIPTTFYTFLGGDMLSREIELGLTREGVELVGEREEKGISSMSLILDFNSDRIIFSHHEERNYSFSYPGTPNFDFIYLTSIGESWKGAYEQVLKYSKENNIPIAFSPGIHQIEEINGTVKEILQNSKIFLANKEEGGRVLGTENLELKNILSGIKSLGPDIVSITDGERGAYAIDENDNIFYTESIKSDSSEKTGAGDAYAAAFFAGFLNKIPIQDSMRWGSLNAHSVMQKLGAQKGLLTKEYLEASLKENGKLETAVI